MNSHPAQTDLQSADGAAQSWILAVECSGTGGSVSLGMSLIAPRSKRRIAERSTTVFPDEGGSVRHLAPATAKLLKEAGIASPDFLAVTVGPGSFTGLRVGLATVKMLAFAWRRKIAPVDTLHAIAYSAAAKLASAGDKQAAIIVPQINAFRKQVFTSAWRFTAGPDGWSLEPMHAAIVCNAAEWQADPLSSFPSDEQNSAEHDPSTEPIVAAGPGLEIYPPVDKSIQLCGGNPMAEDVAQVGWQLVEQDSLVTPQLLSPNYIRQSAAEEKRGATRSAGDS